MSITVREMRREEARRFLEIHHAAVRGIAAKDYPASVVEAWAQPITDQSVARLHLESSITAEPFYAALGYEVESRGELLLAPDVAMASVQMRKRFE